MFLKRYRWTAFAAALVAMITASVITARADLDREASLIQKLGQLDDSPAAKLSPAALQNETLTASRTIDDYLENHWKENNVTANPVAPDQIFVRRVYLDIAGRIPTLNEINDFARDKSPNRRAELIDKLLNSEAYVSNFFNYWADILRIQSDMRGGGDEYAAWVKQALRDNMPYDKFVYNLLTASGYTWENGAAGFYLRDDGMPLCHMSTTVQNFLGTSLVCAQCHDHPFDKWTQYEFYEMAAFTAGVDTRVMPDNLRKAKAMVKGNDRVRFALDNFARPLTYGVTYKPKSIHLPHDYKYDDARPGQKIEPFTIFGKVPEDIGKDPRTAYARWMTSRENPRFTQVIANRLWKKVFGVALIEPVDAMTDDSKATHAPLMEYLTYKMKDYNYDMRRYLRMLYNTRTYQRMSTDHELLPDETYRFTGPMMHRMSAEQLWDSIMTLAVPDIDHRPGGRHGRYSYGQKLAYLSAEQLVAIAEQRADYEAKRNELGDKIRDAEKAGNKALANTLRKQRGQLKPPSLPSEMMTSSGMDMTGLSMNKMPSDDAGKGMSDSEMMGMSSKSSGPEVDPARWKGYPRDYVRASELKSPGGGFLRFFGQSSRDIAGDASTDSNIIQVLAMFNGKMDQKLLAKNSVLKHNLESTDSAAQKLNVIFVSLLGRAPTPYDRQVTGQILGNSQDWDKVVWALLNTREFSFVQ